MEKSEELKFRQFLLNKIQFFNAHKMYMLSGFCRNCYEYGERVNWDRDRLLVSLKANYDNTPIDYYDLIQEIAGQIGSLEEMNGKEYTKISL